MQIGMRILAREENKETGVKKMKPTVLITKRGSSWIYAHRKMLFKLR